MDSKLFSIIIPVYNTESYIERCIYSVINQKIDDYEIIIINDGSSDNSDKIIKNIININSDKKFKYYRQENMGLSVARNKGLSLAEGDYIVWLDSDDALNSDTLYFLKDLTKKKCDVIVNRILTYKESSQTIENCSYSFFNNKVLNRSEIIDELNNLKGFWYCACSFVVKRDVLLKNKILFKDNIYHEDELWSPQLICLSNSFCCNQYEHYIVTDSRKDSITTKKNIKKLFDKLYICIEIFNFTSIFLSEYEKKFLNRRIFFIMYSVYSDLDDYLLEKNFLELKNLFNETMKNLYGHISIFIYILYYIRKRIK